MKKFAKAVVVASLAMASAAPAMAATPTATVDKTFYTDLLNYLQAQMNYTSTSYDAFTSIPGFPQDKLSALQQSYSSLMDASLTLVNYLKNNVTVA